MYAKQRDSLADTPLPRKSKFGATYISQAHPGDTEKRWRMSFLETINIHRTTGVVERTD